MKYVDLKNFTQENGAMPIYLFEGEEAYFREKGEAMLKTRFVQEPTLDYCSFDGASLKGDKLKELVDAVNCFPFISERRIVRVNELYITDKEYEAYLQDTFENPPQNSILLIVNSAKQKTGGAVLAKKPNVTHVDCGRADEETIKRWIYVTCKREGVYADGVTCGKIAAYCVLDMARIAKETEKLLSYCVATQTGKLTDEIVDMLVTPDFEYKNYELAEAVSKKNYSEYMRILQDLSTKGLNETALLSSIASHFRGLYEASLLRGSDKEAAATLGLKEYAVKKRREQAAKFPAGLLFGFYSGIFQAISDIKCGKLTPSSALKRVTAELFFKKS